MSKKLRGLLWLALIIFMAAGSAVGLPTFAKKIPWSWEERLARHFGGPEGARICDGEGRSGAKASFEELLRRLYPLEEGDSKFPLTVQILSGSTVNAYATLGGHVYVYDGLLKQASNPEELAGVLAHEIEHVSHRHIIQDAITEILTFGFLQEDSAMTRTFLKMRFSQKQEHEADVAGLERLKRAQIDAMGFENFFDRLEKLSSVPSLLSDHPASADRAKLARESRGYVTRPLLDGTRWAELKKICD